MKAYFMLKRSAQRGFYDSKPRFQAQIVEKKHVDQRMLKTGFDPETYRNNTLIELHAKFKDLQRARHVFDTMPTKNKFSWNLMISAYARHQQIDNARALFDQMTNRDAVAWTAMIGSYTCLGNSAEAFRLYSQMQFQGLRLDGVCLTEILCACGVSENSLQTMQVHAQIVKCGFQCQLRVQNTLLDSYAKCGDIDSARKVFDGIACRDSVSFNALIAAYARDGFCKEALDLFMESMVCRNKPTQFTFAGVLSACAGIGDLDLGFVCHGLAIKSGFDRSVFVGNAFMDVYAKCGNIEHARQVFDEMPCHDEISWNVMITACVWHGQAEESLRLFQNLHRKGLDWSKLTFSSLFSACANQESLIHGSQVHGLVLKTGVDRNTIVQNALMDMYAKCGCIDTAKLVFESMPNKNSTSWTVLISGCSQSDRGKEALKLFAEMVRLGFGPDNSALATALKACSNLSALRQGKQVHGYLIKVGLESDIFSGSALLDMYAKCGIIDDAESVFIEMPRKNVVSWNAMLSGYSQNGKTAEGIKLFKEMVKTGTDPDYISFVCVLAACSHGGLVKEGCKYFHSLQNDYCIEPRIEHYSCMIDLLARAGKLDDAANMLECMSIQPDGRMWMSLLSGCKKYKNVDLGRYAAEQHLKLNPQDAAPYVMMSHIYSAAEMWKEAAMIKKLMKDRDIKKEPGFSWVDVLDRSYCFVCDDRSHPQTHKIYSTLDNLTEQMRNEGYVPDTSCDLHDVEEGQKELSVCYHSEKLAVAFGLISIPPSLPIRIIKNIRACSDCHSAIKIISKITGRYIVIRDKLRFHHFKNGACSCGDFW